METIQPQSLLTLNQALLYGLRAMASPSAHTHLPLSLETSHSFPDVHTLSPSLSSSSSALASPTPSPSPFLLTLRIVRLLNTFRKRAKTRVHARHPKKVTAAKGRKEFCQDFERQAFAEVDRYLGRKTVYPYRKGRKDGIRKSHPGKNATANSVLDHTEDTVAPGKSIDWCA